MAGIFGNNMNIMTMCKYIGGSPEAPNLAKIKKGFKKWYQKHKFAVLLAFIQFQ
jgi:hypothetical protein